MGRIVIMWNMARGGEKMAKQIKSQKTTKRNAGKNAQQKMQIVSTAVSQEELEARQVMQMESVNNYLRKAEASQKNDTNPEIRHRLWIECVDENSGKVCYKRYKSCIRGLSYFIEPPQLTGLQCKSHSIGVNLSSDTTVRFYYK